MDGEWPRVPLGEVTKNFDAKRVPLSKSERMNRPGAFPYYGPTGIFDYIDGFLFDGLHLLVAEDGSVERDDGTAYRLLADGQFWVNNHAHVIRGVDDIDTRWMFYALAGTPVRPFISGSVQDKLTQASLNRMPVFFPERRLRESTAELLSTLDDRIELNRRMAETLEAQARALFKSWFVDFDPVHAKCEGRPTGLPDDLANLFPARLSHDGLPEGWENRPLSSLGHFLNGLALQKYAPEADTESLPVIKIAELRAGPTAKSGRARADLPKAYVVENGDHLFSWSGSLTHVLWSHGPGALNQHLFKVTPQGVPRWLTYQAVDHHLPAFQAMAAEKAVTMGHIQRRHLDEAMVAIPPNAVYGAADKVMSPIHDRFLGLALQSHTLAALRETLLPKLISGELRIKSAERAVGAVA